MLRLSGIRTRHDRATWGLDMSLMKSSFLGSTAEHINIASGYGWWPDANNLICGLTTKAKMTQQPIERFKRHFIAIEHEHRQALTPAEIVADEGTEAEPTRLVIEDSMDLGADRNQLDEGVIELD